MRTLGAKGFVRVAQVVAEERVDEFQNRRLAAKVAGQRLAAAILGFVPQVVKHFGIGTAKAIDRLFHSRRRKTVCRASRPPPASAADQIDLQRVRVLKFVDQHQVDLRRQPSRQLGMVRIGQQPPRADQQIAEVEHAQSLLDAFIGAGRPGSQLQHPATHDGRGQGSIGVELDGDLDFPDEPTKSFGCFFEGLVGLFAIPMFLGGAALDPCVGVDRLQAIGQ